MKNLIVFGAILAGIQAVSQAEPFFDLVPEQWTSYKLTHRKQYGSDTEEYLRMKIYMDNMHKIAVHNEKYELGLTSYKLSTNKYADMLHHELIHKLNGFNRTKRLLGGNMNEDKCGYDGLTYMAPNNVVLPDLVDWRMKGAVTAVKNQGFCASCWSFSATGSLEGQHFRKFKKLVSLSEQNLIDCSSRYGNNGCNGGLMDYAFKYIRDNHGLDTEKSYPYEAEDNTCRYNPEYSGATDRGFTNIESGNEDDLKSAVATVGPVSVAIDASHESFHFYSEGVYDEPNCDSHYFDHAVLVVGYGTTNDSVDYWIVKNSWGTSWGDKGYILMSRNKDNQCGIASTASYPVV